MANAPESSHHTDNLPRALAWMVLSGISFALMGAMVRLAGDVPLPAKVFFRNLVTLIITSTAALRLGWNPFGPTSHLKLLLARSCCGLLGVLLYFLAITHLDLAEASLLNKTSPFFVTLFAVLLLKEKMNRRLVPVLLTAFVGALLVIRPQWDPSFLPALAGLLSGLFAGMAYTLVRALGGKESPHRIIFYFSFVSTVATLPVFLFKPFQPDGGQWLALIGTGLFAAGGQYGLTFAYHQARASRVSVFTFLHVLFSLVVGFVLWNERPDLLSIIGGLLIIGAAVTAHVTSRREAREAA